jgi:hypothetical protein
MPAVLAIADGHGSPHAARSADGARMAVETAVGLLRATAEGAAGGGPAGLQELAARLPGALVQRWQEAVLRDVESRPLPERGAPGGVVDLVASEPFPVYGTTLLAVAALPEVLLLLQIGDGDILTVTGDGAVARPLPADPRLAGNETTSLGSPDARGDFRVGVISLSDCAPELILVSTDGYANSFRDDGGFRQVGSDLLGLIRKEGLGAVEASLEGWLNEASQQGSGDDVTLGLLCSGALAGGVR